MVDEIIKITKKPETYRDPKDLIKNLINTWSIVQTRDKYQHVVPDMDTRIHILDGTKCWCGPFEYNDCQIRHHANDKRELYDLGYRKRN